VVPLGWYEGGKYTKPIPQTLEHQYKDTAKKVPIQVVC